MSKIYSHVGENVSFYRLPLEFFYRDPGRKPDFSFTSFSEHDWQRIPLVVNIWVTEMPDVFKYSCLDVGWDKSQFGAMHMLGKQCWWQSGHDVAPMLLDGGHDDKDFYTKYASYLAEKVLLEQD